MNQRRARFVEEYLIDGNGTAAAVRAGYAPRSSSVRAARLVKDSEVADAIRDGQAAKAAEAKIDRQAVLERFKAAYEVAKAQGNPAAMVAAAREIGRLCGLYAPEKQVIATTGGVCAERLAAMTDSELEQLVSSPN